MDTNVLGSGDRLQVFGVDARLLLAEMVEDRPVRDRPYVHLVAAAVRLLHVLPDNRVAPRTDVAGRPDPALGGVATVFELAVNAEGRLPLLLEPAVMAANEVGVVPSVLTAFGAVLLDHVRETAAAAKAEATRIAHGVASCVEVALTGRGVDALRPSFYLEGSC